MSKLERRPNDEIRTKASVLFRHSVFGLLSSFVIVTSAGRWNILALRLDVVHHARRIRSARNYEGQNHYHTEKGSTRPARQECPECPGPNGLPWHRRRACRQVPGD